MSIVETHTCLQSLILLGAYYTVHVFFVIMQKTYFESLKSYQYQTRTSVWSSIYHKKFCKGVAEKYKIVNILLQRKLSLRPTNLDSQEKAKWIFLGQSINLKQSPVSEIEHLWYS